MFLHADGMELKESSNTNSNGKMNRISVNCELKQNFLCEKVSVYFLPLMVNDNEIAVVFSFQGNI